MQCPKCNAEMEKVAHENIEVDRCTGCHGIWFDMLEHEDLKSLDGSEKIDIGDAEVGAKYNKIADINCPVCSIKMIPMVDKDQPHIWYEACITCGGVYFDAGEFKDFKESTALDFFKDIKAGERG
ncbi:MAG: zf-TFIIB domain-containing protein [bacterium]|nr:zf-TFIIB domain-containing protein [bacterium]